jgi:hypothetical protein
MITPTAAFAVPGITPSTAQSQAEPDDDSDETSFSHVLSDLNPLQYLPVVGTIYRAVTGDRIPEPMRLMGSFVASGLLGGPVGFAISAGSALVQHLAGIDLDHVAHDALAALGIIDDEPAKAPTTPAPAAIAAYQQTLYTYGPGAGHA